MAKRGVLVHRKNRRLARLLGNLPLACSMGVLEALWHTTATSAPRGDIGVLSNEEIAESMWWDGDPDALVAALVDSGWLGTHEQCRLVVIGWSEHADDAVRKQIDRKGWTFWDGSPPYLPKGQSRPVPTRTESVETQPEESGNVGNNRDRSRNVATCPDISRLPVPEPDPVPEPVPVPVPDPEGNLQVGQNTTHHFKETQTGNDPPDSNQAEIPSGNSAAAARFRPPTVADVRAVMVERGWHPARADLESEKFVARHASAGWVVGKARTPMRDWKAAVSTWGVTLKGQGEALERPPRGYQEPTTNAAGLTPPDELARAREMAARG